MKPKPSYEELEQRVRELENQSEQLKQSEEIYRALVEAAPVSIMAMRNGRIVYANPAGARMLGFSDSDEMVGIPAADVVAPESQQLVTERIQRLEDGKDNPSIELALVKQDGIPITVESISAPIQIDGIPTAFIIAQDISDRKEIEDKLQMMKFCIDHAMDPLVWIASDGRYLYVNDAGCKHVNYSREQFLSMRVSDIDPNFPPEKWREHYEELKKVGSKKLQTHHKVGDGRTVYLDLLSNFVKFGETEFICSYARDITQLKETEQNLVEQLQFEQLIADIAAQLAQTRPEQLEVAIDSTLQALGRFLQTERAFLAQFSDDDIKLVFTNTWTAEGLSRRSKIFDLDMVSEIPWVIQQIRSGEVIKAGPGLTGLPNEAQKLRRQLERDGISSGLVVPVQVEVNSIGMLGLDTIVQARDYAPVIVSRLRIVADMIGSTLHRIQAQEALESSLNEVEQLKDRLEQENIYLREEIEVNYQHEEIVGKSKPVMEMLSRAEQVAETDSTVLILGETGTGKELLARSIHKLSSRKNRQMIKVNCAALPATLIESELFGRERGAYTGAMTRQIGRFEIADGSTIFLDEIGELPLDVQAKLLRVFQEGQFERLGSPQTISVNIRIIASTNRDLARAVMESKFREDLYYRLNVFSVIVPPLRDRIEDLPLLVWALVKEFEKSMGKTIEKIPQNSMDALQQYVWPGNIRELRNVVENAMIMSKDRTLKLAPPVAQSLNVADLKLEVIERNHIIDVLKKTSWRVSGEKGAAKLLGLKATTLESRMKKLGIVRPR